MTKVVFTLILIEQLFFSCLFAEQENLQIKYGFDIALQHEVCQAQYQFDPFLTIGLWAGYQNLKGYIWSDYHPYRGIKRSTNDLHCAMDYIKVQNNFLYTFGFEKHWHIYDQWSHTDIYFILGYSNFFNPSLSFTQNIDQAYGSAINLSLWHQWDKIWHFSSSTPIALKINFNLNYGSKHHNKIFFKTYKAAVTQMEIIFNFPITLRDSCFLTPYLNIANFIDSSVRKQYRHQELKIILGMNLSIDW